MQTQQQDTKTFWLKRVNEVLKGRTIVSVRYLSDKEMELMGWYNRPLAFQLDNGTLCIPSADDEGNDGGAGGVGAVHLGEAGYANATTRH